MSGPLKNIDKFQYEHLEANMLQMHAVDSRRQYFILPSPAFLQLEKEGLARDAKGSHLGRFNKYKIHISVDKDDIGKAWNALLPVLLKNGVSLCKVVREQLLDHFADPEEGQAGKFITVYLMDNQKHVSHLVTEIERTLEENNIRTGPAVKGDKPLTGSKYQFYRNDGIKHYKAADELTHLDPEQRFNPDGHADMFEHFSVAKDANNEEYSFGKYPDIFFSDKGTIQPVRIVSPADGKKLWVFRTRPGLSQQQLEEYRDKLAAYDIRSRILESKSQPGKLYLAVKIEPRSLRALDDIVLRGKKESPTLKMEAFVPDSPARKQEIEEFKPGETTDVFRLQPLPMAPEEKTTIEEMLEPVTPGMTRKYLINTGQYKFSDPDPVTQMQDGKTVELTKTPDPEPKAPDSPNEDKEPVPSGQDTPEDPSPQKPAGSSGYSSNYSPHSSSREENKIDSSFFDPASSGTRTKIGAGLIAAGALGMAASSTGKNKEKEKRGFAKAVSVAVGVIGAGFVLYELFKGGRSR